MIDGAICLGHHTIEMVGGATYAGWVALRAPGKVYLHDDDGVHILLTARILNYERMEP